MKKSKHAGDVRAFIILSQAWYGDTALPAQDRAKGVDEIMMGFYCPDGGTSGEFSIKWAPLGDRLVPRLKAFDDSWSALANFSDVIEKLAAIDGSNPSVEQVATILKSCGVADKTERLSPYSRQNLSDENKVAMMAEVLSVYLRALNNLRDYGRKVSQDPTWAERAEFGVRVPPIVGVPEDLYNEVVDKVGAIASRRTALADALKSVNNKELTKIHAHLIAED